MKKIAASFGLIAIGATSLHAAEASTLSQHQTSKAWSVAATLRGFYDDNITAIPEGPGKTESMGIQISPSVDYGFAGEQTSFNIGYEFTARFFDKQAPDRVDKSDYTHVFDADLSHVFSPRLDLRASESFVIGQEPDLLRDAASTQPIEGDNIRNFASVAMTMEATQLLGFEVGYNNSLYDYDDEGQVIGTGIVVPPGNGIPLGELDSVSNSGLYDRMEHALRLDTQWKIQPQTTGIIGYTYSQTAYTGDEAIAGNTTIAGGLPGGVVYSDYRDSRGQTFYVGAEQVFSPTLSAALNIGAQHYDYYNDPTGEAQWSPYAQGSMRYMYQSVNSIDVGIRYSRAAGNSAGGAGTTFVRDTESAVIYGSVRHALASKLFLTGNATLQNSTYNAPGSTDFDDKSYMFIQLGLDLAYEFNPNLSGHFGYNYDQYESDIVGTDYDRNRVYLGVTAGF